MFEILWGRGLSAFRTRDSFIYIFNSFTFLGTRPPQTRRFLYFLYSAVVNVNCVILSPIIFNMGYMMDLKQLSVAQILTNLQACVNVLGVPVKVVAVTLYMKRLRSFDLVLDELDTRYKRPEEIAKIRRSVMVGNRTIVYFGIAYGLYETMTLLSAIIQGRPLFPVYVPFWDWRNSKIEYWLQVSYETVLLFYILYHQVVNDCYPVSYIYAIRTHLQLLIDRVLNLCTDPKKTHDDNFGELVQCIRDHQLILELLDIVSPVISLTVFVQFLIMAAVLGTTMINIFIFADTSTQIASVCYLVAVLIQTSPTCYQATHLMEDNENLPVAIFHSNWIEQNQRYRKMLIFFMHRSQMTMTLTAGKLFLINLNTNLSLGKFSFSLFTLIKEMDLGQKFNK